MLVLVNTTNTRSQDDNDDCNLNNNNKKKFKMGMAAAAAAVASILVLGGTTTTTTTTISSSAGFSSNNNNNNNINNDFHTAGVEINMLRTSTYTNMAEAEVEATTTLTPNCCNVADGNFDSNSYLQDCFKYKGDGFNQFCWSKRFFDDGGSSIPCFPQGYNWYYDFRDYNCGPPCATFENYSCK